jgi:hypothetical protein
MAMRGIDFKWCISLSASSLFVPSKLYFNYFLLPPASHAGLRREEDAPAEELMMSRQLGLMIKSIAKFRNEFVVVSSDKSTKEN